MPTAEETAITAPPPPSAEASADAAMPVPNQPGQSQALVPKRGFLLKAKQFLAQAPVISRLRATCGDSTLVVAERSGEAAPPRRPGFFRRHFLFLPTVAIPTLLSIGYFGFYASDIYVSQSSYMVRSPSQKSIGGTGLGALLQGAAGLSGFTRAPDDVHAVAEYILSRDALQRLQEKLDVRTWWSDSSVDLLQRFNPLGWSSSMESLLKYYPRRVNIFVDDKTGITTLTAYSFTASQAAEMNSLLLGEAERLVNELSDRGRRDLIRFAKEELAAAEQKAKDAAEALSDFRNTKAVVDPEKQTMLHLEQISRLQEELIRTRGQLTQLKVFAPESPHPPALELRAKTLEQEIAAETEKITGGDNSLASRVSEYRRLQLEREFADNQVAAAMTAFEVSSNEAQRQQLYLETIDGAEKPDEAIYPKRLRGIFTTLLLGLIAWGILSMLIAGLREHQQ